MEINYDTFEKALKEGNYEDAFYILFRMIDNMDPDSIKADKKWTKVVRKNTENETIKSLEKEFKHLPKLKKREIERKFYKLQNEKNSNIGS